MLTIRVRPRNVARFAALIVGLPLGAGPCLADGKKLNQDQVLEAVKNGQIRPLADVLAAAAVAVPGRVIRVDIERKHGRTVYEVKIIGNHGRVREVYIDAASLEVLKVE